MRHFFQIRYSALSLVLLGGLALFIGWHALKSYQNYRSVKIEYDSFQERIEKLEARTQELRADVAFIESAEGKERLLRERFDVKKKGEEVIIFIKEDESSEEPRSALRSFTSYLKNLFGF
ncbi:MAG: septum formation initiator family protein [Candidatus Niyogibacteria bacterium]|nr:septum formation initiator family protein [Candidatus Niyogibacteria bacterium]